MQHCLILLSQKKAAWETNSQRPIKSETRYQNNIQQMGGEKGKNIILE